MAVRDPVSLVVPLVGRLEETGRASEPYHLINPAGAVEEPVALYFAEMQAAQRPAKTIRSYGMDLLRWYRFLWAVGIEWDRAERADARDFARWLRLVDKPMRVHWRHVDDASRAAGVVPVIPGALRAGAGEVNQVTGKPSPGRKFAASTRAHNETVVRTFYDFHLEAGNGPIINPFPLHRSRASGRAHAHHNPMEEFRKERVGRYRPTVPKRIPRRIPDEKFNALFAGLRSHRDRALLAFWVSSGVRSEELLTCRECDPIPGDQVISVIRKGTRDQQLVPASPDAFVWLRLCQEEAWAKGVPRGRRFPLWWTLRRPWRPLGYAAARAMFDRANELLGANWTLHDLRHTASYRMAEDPQLVLTDVRWVLAHARLSTTQVYLTPSPDEVIAKVRGHHVRRAREAARPTPVPPADGYNPAALDVLFGGLR
ncbi:tyrosine-type recombinase/integrase [Streptomyces sp. NPDC002285]